MATYACPWLCQCGRRNGKRMDYCPRCTRHWQTGTPIEQQTQEDQTRYVDWDSSQAKWEDEWQDEPWVKSPRGRQQSPRQRHKTPKNRRRRRGGDRQARQGDQRPLAPPPPPPVPGPPKWDFKSPSLTSAPSTMPAEHPEAAQYREIMNVLKSHDGKGTLPTDVQEKVQKYTTKTNKALKKDMHSAVDALDKAKEDLQAAIGARSNMHAAWRAFLAESVTRFRAYGQDFATQEHDLLERIGTATEVFNQAKEDLSRAKEKATQDPTCAQVISDEEAMADVPVLSPDKIAASLTTLTSSLEELKTQAEDLEKEEQKHKRPRLEEAAPPAPSTTAGLPTQSFA
eukprot:s2353_g13.t1